MKGRHLSESTNGLTPLSQHCRRVLCLITHAYTFSVTDEHTRLLTNFPCVSAVSSLHCNSRRPTHPLFRVIEYRSLALPQCVSECACEPVCLTEALQGHCHGNLSKGSSRCSVTVHRSEGSHEKKGGL